MKTATFSKVGALAIGAIILAAAGCSPRQSSDRAAVEIRGSTPSGPLVSAPTAPPGAPPSGAIDTTPDASGVITYDGYQAAVARSGDTVGSVAERIGLSASELGSYNGLSPTHPLREGDELVLPQRPDGYATGGAVAAAPAYPDSGSQIAPADPLTTQIEAAPLDGSGPAPAPAASGAGGWSPDIASAAIDRAVGIDDQGNLAAPPSATEPLPPDPARPVALASPQLRQYQTPAQGLQTSAPQPRPVETITTPAEQSAEDTTTIDLAAAPSQPPAVEQTIPQPAETQPAALRPTGDFRLIRPVAGPVVTRFNQGTGRARNDGIDFASPSGSPVVAAAEGEVALVSQSLGGLGTIVLVRHPDDYLTVYGRIERVTVGKGDLVSRGQQIGVVSPSAQPRMHFEVRQGAESLDPERFF